MFLILETVPHCDPRPKEAVHSHIHRISLPVRRLGVQLYMHAWLTVFTLRWYLATLMLPWSAAGRLWGICCVNDVSQRLVLNVQNVQNAALRASEIRILPHKLRKRRSLPFCTTSGVKRPSVHVVARREWANFLLICWRRYSQRVSLSGRRSVLSSPTSSWRRTTTMLINLGSRVPFTDSFPVCQATRKTVALYSTLLVLQGEKSGRWSSSPRHGAFSNRSCAHRFAPKWPALTAPRQRSQPWTRLATSYTVLRALQRSDAWKLHSNVACACDETRPGSIAKTCSQTVSAHAVDFETKLETSRGVHWQRWTPPPCVRAWTGSVHKLLSMQPGVELESNSFFVFFFPMQSVRLTLKAFCDGLDTNQDREENSPVTTDDDTDE